MPLSSEPERPRSALPPYQRGIQIIAAILGGVVGFGALLDAVANSSQLIDAPIAGTLSGLALVGWVAAGILVRRYKPQWRTDDGQLIRVTRLGAKPFLYLVGVAVLAWLPVLYRAQSTTIPIASSAVSQAPPTAPAANTPTPPQFAATEAGILLEATAFRPEHDDIRSGRAIERVIMLRGDHLRKMFEEECTGCGDRVPPLRVALVPRVTPTLVAESGALLGIAGPIDFVATAGDHGEYLLRDATAFLNLAELHPDAQHLGQLTVTMTPARSAVVMAINYREGLTVFPLNALGAVGRSDVPRTPKLSFSTHYIREGEIRMGANGDPAMTLQNLNRSVRSEFALLEAPERATATEQVLDTAVLARSDLEALVSAAILTRVNLAHALPSAEPLAIDCSFINAWISREKHRDPSQWPSEIDFVEQYLRADVALLELGTQQTPDDACAAQKSLALLRSAEGPYLLHDLYAGAAKLASKRCVECYLRMAQLMFFVDDFDAVLRDLQAGIDNTTGAARAKLVHAAAKYQAAYVLQPERKPDMRAVARTGERLTELRRLEFNTLATFEEARLQLAWGTLAPWGSGASTVEKKLRDILQARPRHLFTRYLLTKQLNLADQETHRLLASILDDLVKTGDAYDYDLHSLGAGDEVLYSVDPTFVVEDSIHAAVARCDLDDGLDVVRKARMLPEVDWNRIMTALGRRYGRSGYHMFPSVGIGVAAFDVGERCPSFREIQDQLRRAVGR